MEIERNFYLSKLVSRMGGELVKVITGIRQCGKSYLLFNLFKRHLLQNGVKPGNIVEIALDERKFQHLRDPLLLSRHISDAIKGRRGMKYVLIDEIQFSRKVLAPGVDLKSVAKEDRESCYVTFYDVLNEFRKMEDVDVYVTGSNSKMLSSDVATEFRGRGDEIRVHPLSFAEYLGVSGKDKQEALEEYLVWGGMPLVALEPGASGKEKILKDLFSSIYIKDIVERHSLKDDAILTATLDVLASATGSLTNPNKLVNTLDSQSHLRTTNRTFGKYLKYMEDAFLFSKASRWDVRGKKHLEFPCKFYCEDLGLRNARLNFREIEFPHLMENAIWNELVRRGYAVDVGVVQITTRKGGERITRNHEIDFIVNSGSRKLYIQSAFSMDGKKQAERETLPLKKTGDFFGKIVVRSGYMRPMQDDDGIMHVGLIPFLLEPEILSAALG